MKICRLLVFFSEHQNKIEIKTQKTIKNIPKYKYCNASNTILKSRDRGINGRKRLFAIFAENST